MPTITNNGWSNTQIDPNYQNSVNETFNRFNTQLHTWGDNVDWTLPTVTANPLVGQAAEQFQKGSDIINDAWNKSGYYFNEAGQQYENLSKKGPAEVKLGEGVYDKMDPEMQAIFQKYDLSSVDTLLQQLGTPDTADLRADTESWLAQLGSSQFAFTPSYGGGSTAAGAAVKAVDPNRQNVRDINGINSIDELQAYLDKLDSGPFNQLQSVAEKDIERQRQIQMQQVASQAAAQNAFGGGRQGVVEGETNRAALDTQERLSADMAGRKLDFANAILQTDIGRRMNAQQLNQAADLALESERAQLGTQANIATGQNQTQASIANAETSSRAAMAQMQAQAQYAAQMLGARANLMGQEIAGRANLIDSGFKAKAGLIGGQEILKPTMIKTQGDLLNELAIKQYDTESGAATKNADLYNSWLTYQAGIGDKLSSLGTDTVAAGTATAKGLGEMGTGMGSVGTYLTGLDKENAWNKWYGDYMTNMWQPTLTQIELNTLLSEPYGTQTESGSTTKKPTSLLDILGLVGQGAGVAVAASSDPRLKSGIKNTKGSALDRIANLRPIEYSVRGDKKKERLRGLLATEVGKASSAYEAKLGAYNAVNLEPIIADIVGAVQELAGKGRKKNELS